MRYGNLRLALSLVLTLCLRAVAQLPSAPQPDISAASSGGSNIAGAPAQAFSARVREVNVLFSASNWRDRFVSNLKPSDIRVFDNGRQPLSFTYFLHETDLPLRVALLIDISGSVEHLFQSQQRAAILFLQQTLRPSDSASVMVFAVKTEVVQNFTSSLEILTSAVRRLAPSQGETAIYDAVRNACDQLGGEGDGSVKRRALILITDGDDNRSRLSIDQAIEAAIQDEVVVFALNTSRAPVYTYPPLQKLTESTGGRVLHAYKESEMKFAFRKVNEQLRNQYLLGYKPPRWRADHSFHRIRVTTHRFGLYIHCRKGYYAIE
jgi:Ca-activated chloride channel homolog